MKSMNLGFFYTLFASGFCLIINETADVPPLSVLYHHMTAEFGIQNYEARYATTAPLVRIQPEIGCLNIKNKNELKGAIVLVKRGTCNYFDKALTVKMYGGVGMVVGNDESNKSLLWMASNNPGDVDTPQIPCVAVTKSTYDAAVAKIRKEPAGSVIATISLAGDIPPPNIWTFPSLVQITTWLLIAFPVVWALLTLKHFCRRDPTSRRELRRRLRSIPEVLFTNDLVDTVSDAEDKDSKQLYKKKKARLTNSSCPICLDNFEKQTKIKILPCEHGFHSNCIEPWIADHHNDSCPICRQTVTDKIVGKKYSCCCRFSFFWRSSNEDQLRQPLIGPGMVQNDENVETRVVIHHEEDDQMRIVAEPTPSEHDPLLSSNINNDPTGDQTLDQDEVKIEESKHEASERTIDF